MSDQHTNGTGELFERDAQAGLLSAARKDPKIRALLLSRLTEADFDRVDRTIYRLVADGARMLPDDLPGDVDERLLDIESRFWEMPTFDEALSWVGDVQNASALRAARDELLRTATGIGRGSDASAVASSVVTSLSKITNRIQSRAVIDMKTASTSALNLLDQWLAGDMFAGTVRAFITMIDQQLFGFLRGQVHVLGGRPSMGKTAVALQIMRNNAIDILANRTGEVVVFVSLDMSAEMVTFRMASSMTGINLRLVRDPYSKLAESERERFREQVIANEVLPIEIVKMASPTAADIIAKIDEILIGYTGGVRMVVVDYIERMRGKGSNETAQVDDIMNGLKIVAERYNCPVLALSQLGREVDKKADRMPEIHHLRQSGSIEAVAQTVMLCWYPDGYALRTNRGVMEYPTPILREIADRFRDERSNYRLIVVKDRDGTKGAAIRMAFEPKTTRFADELTDEIDMSVL